MSAKNNNPAEGLAADGVGAEEALIQSRRQKAERLRARGGNPFANDVSTENRIQVSELRAQAKNALVGPEAEQRYDIEKVQSLFDDRVFVVLGRLMARRGFGKVVFLRIRDGSGEVQLFVKQDVLGEAFSVLEDLDIADFVQARGTVMVTQKGELSIMVSELRLVTKAIRPLPDKWHGLTDVQPQVPAALRRHSCKSGSCRCISSALGDYSGPQKLSGRAGIS